jgi:mono/diheme cytochrome c family protein
MKISRVIFLGPLSVAVLASCQGEVNPPGPDVGRAVSLASDVQPIFERSCVSCHRPGAFANLSGIDLVLTAGQSRASLVNQPSSQNAALTLVVPGDSAASLLFLKVSSNMPPVGSTMPLFGARLNSSELALIRDWIDQGALDN